MADRDEARKGKRSLSLLDPAELLRNLIDRVDEDGVREHGLLELISMIQMDCRNNGIVPLAPIVINNAGAAAVNNQDLVFCPAGSRIVIFDVFLSLTGAANVTFTDQNNVQLFAGMNAANPGQGFSRTSQRGLHLPAGSSLRYSCSAATAHKLDISYAIIPTES